VQQLDTSERDFHSGERRALLPYARVYIVVAGAILLLYSAVNPFFFGAADAIYFSELMVVSVVLLAGYFGVTFWPRYPELPAIDFAALLALAIVVIGDNVLLFDELNQLDPNRHANISISAVVVSAFAAVTFAGRQRWFLLWLGCHAAASSIVILTFETATVGRVYTILSYMTGATVMIFLNWALGRLHRTAFQLRRALDAERQRNEELLYNVLPQAAVERLKAGQVVADSFGDVSVIFIDVVGFSKLAKTVSPGHLIDMLNSFFGLADRCAGEAGVEKIKTIGDAFLAISGGNAPATNSAQTALAFSQAVIAGIAEVRAATGLEVQIRVGIHSGPVVGGVIGATRVSYDYWGETMNVASRIQGCAEPDGIAVSESTYLRTKGGTSFAAPEMVVLKGIGEMPVYRVVATG
jgi:adenylate cyclase